MSERTIPVLRADASTFEVEVSRVRDELVIVYFSGTDCRNCEAFAAELPRLLADLGDVPARLVKVDAYVATELATRFGLHGVPTFLLFRDGKKLGRISGFPGRAALLEVLREHLRT